VVTIARLFIFLVFVVDNACLKHSSNNCLLSQSDTTAFSFSLFFFLATMTTSCNSIAALIQVQKLFSL